MAIFAIWSSAILSTWSLHALLFALVHRTTSETPQGSLIFSLLFISFSACPVMNLRTGISVVLSKRLVVVFSALVSAVYVITGLTYVL